VKPNQQVEHTVTEEITNVDLVASQLRIAGGQTLRDLGLSQDALQAQGAALQCRITTEDPANGFRPDTGRITAYRTPGGAGIRLDGGTNIGAEVSAYFDSLLVKLTAGARTSVQRCVEPAGRSPKSGCGAYRRTSPSFNRFCTTPTSKRAISRRRSSSSAHTY
jgi:pyruvate carboxylase